MTCTIRKAAMVCTQGNCWLWISVQCWNIVSFRNSNLLTNSWVRKKSSIYIVDLIFFTDPPSAYEAQVLRYWRHAYDVRTPMNNFWNLAIVRKQKIEATVAHWMQTIWFLWKEQEIFTKCHFDDMLAISLILRSSTKRCHCYFWYQWW